MRMRYGYDTDCAVAVAWSALRSAFTVVLYGVQYRCGYGCGPSHWHAREQGSIQCSLSSRPRKLRRKSMPQKKKQMKVSQANLGHMLPKHQAQIGTKERGKAARPGSGGSQGLSSSKGGNKYIAVIPPIASGRKKDAPESLDELRKHLAMLTGCAESFVARSL
eukprot:gene25413-11071_t